jgi:hypothetical protein
LGNFCDSYCLLILGQSFNKALTFEFCILLHCVILYSYTISATALLNNHTTCFDHKGVILRCHNSRTCLPNCNAHIYIHVHVSLKRVQFFSLWLCWLNQYSKNYTMEHYKIDNIPQQLITNILKKKPKQQNTSKYDKTSLSLSVVQRIHKTYLSCSCFNKNKDGKQINFKQF